MLRIRIVTSVEVPARAPQRLSIPQADVLTRGRPRESLQRMCLNPRPQDERTSTKPAEALAAPLGVDIARNVREAQGMSPFEFYDAVKSGGKWDYKRIGPQFQNFGNYHFGIVAAAFGWNKEFAKRLAGAYQKYWTNTSKEEWGEPWSLEGPYGDDPVDQFWIEEGFRAFELRYQLLESERFGPSNDPGFELRIPDDPESDSLSMPLD